MLKLARLFLLATALMVMAACASAGDEAANQPPASATALEAAAAGDEAPAMPMGPGRMGGGGMMARHHAAVPDEYAGLSNPVPADEDSLARGAAIYEQYCVSCHGEGGMGDGAAGQQLDPPPAPVAHTSGMLGDDYLFWRISEGGAHEPFSSAMPRWQDVLEEGDRWDVINYVRALGSGQPLPGGGPGRGQMFDPAAEAAQHEQMAAEGQRLGVISGDEAETFVAVHALMDELMTGMETTRSGGMQTNQQAMLDELVAQGRISGTEADTFTAAHDKLLAAGLMQ